MSNFNRSFVNAIPLGMKASNDWQANERADAQLKMQQAAEARTQTKFDQEQDTYNKLQVLQKQLTNPNADNYSLGNSATEFAPSPVSVPMSISDSVPDVPQLGLTTGVKLGGEGMKVQSGEGMQPKQQLGLAPAKKLTANKAPERGAASNILAEIALLKGDHEGFARHKQTAADFDYEDGYNSHMKTALSADDKQRASLFSPLVGYLNTNSKQLTIGKEDKKGFRDVSITTADGEAMFARLSKQDQAKLYAAHMMMESNPTKAMAVMQSVNKDLAAAIAADNNLYGDITKTNNDTAGKRHTAQHQDDTLAETARYRKGVLANAERGLRLQEDRANRESWSVQGADDNGNAVLVNRYTGETKLGPKMHHLGRGAGAGAGTGDTPLPDTTIPYKTPEGLIYNYDDYGNKVARDGGVSTSERAGTLTKSGVPADMAASLRWNNHGTAVQYGDLSYSVKDPRDMALLAKKIREDQLHNKAGEEATLRGKGILDSRDARVASAPKPPIFSERGVMPSAPYGVGNGVIETRRGPVEVPEGVEAPPHLRYLNGQNPLIPYEAIKKAQQLGILTNNQSYNNTMGAVR